MFEFLAPKFKVNLTSRIVCVKVTFPKWHCKRGDWDGWRWISSAVKIQDTRSTVAEGGEEYERREFLCSSGWYRVWVLNAWNFHSALKVATPSSSLVPPRSRVSSSWILLLQRPICSSISPFFLSCYLRLLSWLQKIWFGSNQACGIANKCRIHGQS